MVQPVRSNSPGPTAAWIRGEIPTVAPAVLRKFLLFIALMEKPAAKGRSPEIILPDKVEQLALTR